MKQYFPQLKYCTTSQFQQSRCGFPQPKARPSTRASVKRYMTRVVSVRRIGRAYSGRVIAATKTCRQGRTIRLRRAGERGAVLATGRTHGDGAFTVRGRRRARATVYLAVATKRTSTVLCDAGLSKRIAPRAR